ncbi:MAG TPA: DUF4142 domain-containing protein [Abditibacteriaceae bacterium]
MLNKRITTLLSVGFVTGLALTPVLAQHNNGNAGTGNAGAGNGNNAGASGGKMAGNSGTLTPLPVPPPAGAMSPAATALDAATRANFDRLFIAKAAQGNMAEVMTGQLALRKSQNAQVRQLAQHLVTGHGVANTDLLRVATTNNVPPPTFVGAMHAATHDHLSRLSGAQFDQMYLAAQVEAHENAITLYQQELAVGTNPEARAYAARILPEIMNHTTMIYTIARAVNAPGLSDRPQDLVNAAVAAGTIAMRTATTSGAGGGHSMAAAINNTPNAMHNATTGPHATSTGGTQ